MEIITYEAIRSVHRTEKETELQKLPENFYSAVRNWFAHKEKLRDTASLLEVENARKLIDDIISMREKKIVLAALRTVRGEMPPRNLTDSEQRLFNNILNILKTFKEDISEEFKGKVETVEEKIEEVKESMKDLRKEEKAEEMFVKPNGKMMLKILTDLPRFVGSNMAAYGPLKAGDIISLPDDVGKLLINRKVAENLLG